MASMITGLATWLLLIIFHAYHTPEQLETEYSWWIGSEFSPMVLGLLASIVAIILGSWSKK
jgi:Na+(H+)/acetate symporter ActP